MDARFGSLPIVLGLLCASPAAAHPHVWVTVGSEVIFSRDGKITGVRHTWIFDEMYSAYAVQGLGKDGRPPTREELAPLVKTNVEALAEAEYFTLAKQGNVKLKFKNPVDATLEVDQEKIVTLRFTLPLETPVAAQKPFSFEVYDPTYYIAFELKKQNPVTMARAPSGCSLSLVEPQSPAAAETQKMTEAFFQSLSPGAFFGIKFATRVNVICR